MSEERVEVLIIGAGFAGLGMAIRLKQTGLATFVVLEAEPGLGGTWWANHYPGAACDVQSHLYSFSFEPNPSWSYAFARQPEILAYLEHCADKYDVRTHIRFGAEVTSARWDEGEGRWHVATRSGQRYSARWIASGCGGLSRPALPDIPGLQSFSGKSMHSARWDDAYPLEGKDVAIIGTGASAIQIVPEIVGRVRSLAVYQRTPPWIIPRPDHPIGPRAQRAYQRTPALQLLARTAIYWTREIRRVAFKRDSPVMKLGERMALAHLRRSVPDPALRQKLTPRYRMGCKRVLLSNDYYQALLRPNVEVVTEGIERISERGVVSQGGRERNFEVLVCATGFHAADMTSPFPVVGRGGRKLDDVWGDGAEAYKGTTVPGFPNLFVFAGPNTGLGHNSMVFMLESQIEYVLDALRTMRDRRLRDVEVRAEATLRYNAELQGRLEGTVWASGCEAWYRTRSGKNTTLWPGFTFEFLLRTRRFDVGHYHVKTGPA